MDGGLQRSLRAAGARVEAGASRALITPAGREATRRVAELLAEHRVAWTPVGGGRRTVGLGGVGVATSGLSGLLDLWSEDLVCTVGAGTPLAWLDAQLLEHGLRLSACAPRFAQATVGGVFASADRGLCSAVNGGLRDRVLGGTFVDGLGNLVKAGARVVKNVAGYDLARLHHGARGAFGLMLDLVVRLDARPQAHHAARWPCSLATLRKQLPAVRRPHTDLDPHVQAWVNAAAARALALADRAQLVAAVEGWAETIEVWRRQSAATTSLDLQPVRDLLQRDRQRWLVRWSAPPSAWIELWPDVESQLQHAGADPWAIGDCLAGEMHIAVRPSVPATTILQRLVRPGCPVHLDWASQPPPVPPGASSIARRLKHAFDPHGLLPELPGPWPATP